MKRRTTTALPPRPIVDPNVALALLAKQFAARRRAWERHLRERLAETGRTQ